MFYRRKGFPEENDIVLCKVTKIYPNSVFVNLLEYNDSGIIHISEVSPGRIRNLRDYVSVGRQIVCKILRVDREKGHIDLSLRRVNSHQRQEKLDAIKAELKAESLVKNLAKKVNMPAEKLYKDLTKGIFKNYSHLFLAFKEVADGDVNVADLGVPKKVEADLEEAIKEKFKPQKISIEGEITLKTYHADGVDRVTKTLKAVDETSETVDLFYLGAGRFKLVIEDFEYKDAEKTLKKIQKHLDKFNDKKSVAELTRID